MDNMPHLQQLLRQLQQVPYLASKNLYRVAHFFLQMDERKLEQFIHTLKEMHLHIVQCETCCAWKERDMSCTWCAEAHRDQSIICVVETWHDLCAIEKSGAFPGSYHVLGSALCPLEGIGPEDLTIEQLMTRVQKDCKEIILPMNQTPEGEATAAFIARRLEPFVHTHSLKITCLSRGVPVGSSLEMMDRLTVFKAMAERRNF